MDTTGSPGTKPTTLSHIFLMRSPGNACDKSTSLQSRRRSFPTQTNGECFLLKTKHKLRRAENTSETRLAHTFFRRKRKHANPAMIWQSQCGAYGIQIPYFSHMPLVWFPYGSCMVPIRFMYGSRAMSGDPYGGVPSRSSLVSRPYF